MSVGPGTTKLFKYYGEEIPNAITFTPLNNSISINFKIKSGLDSWELYDTVSNNTIMSIIVHWPSTVAEITNLNTIGDLIVGGDGIFPIL